VDWNSWVAFLGSPILVPLWYENFSCHFLLKKIFS